MVGEEGWPDFLRRWPAELAEPTASYRNRLAHRLLARRLLNVSQNMSQLTAR
jgi:hypothetical protein